VSIDILGPASATGGPTVVFTMRVSDLGPDEAQEVSVQSLDPVQANNSVKTHFHPVAAPPPPPDPLPAPPAASGGGGGGGVDFATLLALLAGSSVFRSRTTTARRARFG
jgi:hypothetical protein